MPQVVGHKENPLCDSRLCAPVWAKGPMSAAVEPMDVRENQNQTEVTGYQRFEPIRIDRASTETLAVDSCSVHQLPRSPARTPQEFSLCLRGRRIAQGVAALDAGGLHPIDGTTLYWPINLTFPFGCIICKTKPKYSNSSMGLRRLPRREICCEHSGDPDQPFQAIPITHSDRSRSVWRVC